MPNIVPISPPRTVSSRRGTTWASCPAKIGGDRADWGWVAGIMDGEGTFSCCTISGGRWKYPQIRIVVSQSSDEAAPQMLGRLCELFGGRVYGPYSKPKSMNRKPVFNWTITGLVRVQAIVAVIWPWLGDVKREQYVKAIRRYMSEYADKSKVAQHA